MRALRLSGGLPRIAVCARLSPLTSKVLRLRKTTARPPIALIRFAFKLRCTVGSENDRAMPAMQCATSGGAGSAGGTGHASRDQVRPVLGLYQPTVTLSCCWYSGVVDRSTNCSSGQGNAKGGAAPLSLASS